MKAILVLSLLFVCVFTEETVPIEPSNDIIDIIKCFLGKEERIKNVQVHTKCIHYYCDKLNVYINKSNKITSLFFLCGN